MAITPMLGDSLRSDIPRMAGVFFDTGRFAFAQQRLTPTTAQALSNFGLNARGDITNRLQAIAKRVRAEMQNSQRGAVGFGAEPQYYNVAYFSPYSSCWARKLSQYSIR